MGKSIVGCQESKNPAEIRQVFQKMRIHCLSSSQRSPPDSCGNPKTHVVLRFFDAAKKIRYECGMNIAPCAKVRPRKSSLSYKYFITSVFSGSDPAVSIPSQTELVKQQACARLAITICGIAAPPISWQVASIHLLMQPVFLVTKNAFVTANTYAHSPQTHKAAIADSVSKRMQRMAA